MRYISVPYTFYADDNQMEPRDFYYDAPRDKVTEVIRQNEAPDTGVEEYRSWFEDLDIDEQEELFLQNLPSIKFTFIDEAHDEFEENLQRERNPNAFYGVSRWD